MTTGSLLCDGCGQPASPEHIARRLQRLEWTTRYRPVHIGTLLLGAISPQNDVDFLYFGKFAGQAAQLVEVTGIHADGKAPEAVLAEFQRGGYFLIYLMDCPLESTGASDPAVGSFLAQRVSAVLARVRRSLRPRRTVLFDQRIAPLTEKLSNENLGCPVLLDAGKPFAVGNTGDDGASDRLRAALSRPASFVT